ncbi:unnamed protein product [Thelazia callipaeda]|uniref:PNT domain-containing protein n=1 Tax=Thelazia callipaeda TaxID=103827 RepID=A0A0N5D408_THECL|nr:unnamed protein product [Thelazia callipaeda]
MCLPALFDHFGNEVLRTHMNSAVSSFKPIPNNERVDLTRFLTKEPQEWSMEDVIAWLLHVAKRNGIPYEELEMQKFANCTGSVLTQMHEIDFKRRDAVYGSLLYSEFRKLIAGLFLCYHLKEIVFFGLIQVKSWFILKTEVKSLCCNYCSISVRPLEPITLQRTHCKVRKNKDGRPRKHSQHSKGNKLWEFIRDALKDPSTCPSVVR